MDHFSGSADLSSRSTELFSRSWAALRAAVADLPGPAFEQPSGCTGWLVRDLVCHLVIDAQDVLITLATPASTEPTVDAVTYWHVGDEPPTGEDPLDALTVRLAAAYQDPALLTFHLDDVGAAAGRAAGLADPDARVSTQEQVLTVGDYLTAYVLEWTLHHLDLIAHLPDVPGPPAEGLARARALLEGIADTAFPEPWCDTDVLLVGTGRRPATEREKKELGALAGKLPLVIG
ncbi:maleylpyruvate isomerase N-terminal domain-containing protein [Streptomyces sp. NPDC102364]|uniref:maleylpyruvate isomerase N-terminal domain-containing protein n=1 Tax=unclassified Streptomyces TaxID=2593676 RepID=UPI002E254347